MRAEAARIAAALALLAMTGATAAPSAIGDQRRRLAIAQHQAAAAARRAAALSDAAARERDAVKRTIAQERALGARIVVAEAELASAQARAALIAALSQRQQRALGAMQRPVAGLLAALASLARRPAVAAIAQPGSIDDSVHIRGVLQSILPVVRRRTADVRAAVARTRDLHRAAADAEGALRAGRARLEADRVALDRLVAAHRNRGEGFLRGARDESDRALALGERARDLVDSMVAGAVEQATVAGLAAIDGPLPRPLAPGARPPHVAGSYRLPVVGRLVTGLDEIASSGARSRGLTFAVAPGARVVAPAAGTVRYAQRFRGYGTIVIIDHGDGWTSLVTGLGGTPLRPGSAVDAGASIGAAMRGDDPRVTVELRRRGQPMDIAALVG